MKVLVHSTEFPPGPGGIGTQAWELARNLHALGWEVMVVSPQDYASEEEIEVFGGRCEFRVWRVGRENWWLRNAAKRVRAQFEAMKQWQPDVVIATGDRAVYGSAAASYRHRCPWVAVEHGRIPRGWEHRTKKWALRRACVMVSVSRFTRDQLLMSGVRPRREVVIPNGADARRFTMWTGERIRSARTAMGFSPKELLLLTVGNVTYRKGQDTVIRALPEVVRHGCDAHYLIAGLPSKQAEFEGLARELGVKDRVHFLGRVSGERTVELMNCCDLFVMTSRRVSDDFEGYGIAAVEAALCGKPSVVSAESGLAEAVVDGVTGIAVPESNPQRTALAIVELLKNDSQRIRYGAAARQRALAHQTWERVVAGYNELLMDLVGVERHALSTTVPASHEVA